jgi:ribose transport system permease protein
VQPLPDHVLDEAATGAAPAVGARVRNLVANNQWLVLLVVTAIIAVGTGAQNGRFWSPDNISSLFQQISVLGLVATGATLLIISGNFDISVDSYVGLSVCIMPMLLNAGWAPLPAVLTGIAVCVACSVFNGVASIVFKAPSFIVSLATLGMFMGISLQITGGVIQNAFGRFSWLTDASIGFVPLIFVITLVGYVVTGLMLGRTKLGRRVYAIGNNPDVAYRAGISVDRSKIVFFLINGLLVGVAAFLLLARVGGGLPSTGSGLAMQGIGAAVIGGVPITGGKGSVLGTFFGVLLLGVIANALNILNVSPYAQDIAQGALILFAIAISALRMRLGATR